MSPILDSIIEYLKTMSWVEGIAVVFSVVYVVLAAKGSLWCWPAALISVIAYTILCFQAQLFAETLLQVFYGIMAVVGWLNWKENRSKKDEMTIQTWPAKYHVINLVVSGIAWIALGLFLMRYTEAQLPFLDSFTTVFSIAATFMVTQRVLGNWIYWIVIDVAGIYLYGARGFYLSSALYLSFSVIAVIGFFKWRDQYQLQHAA